MKANIFVLVFVFIAALFVFSGAFFNFFAQDDFILISQFSGHGLVSDIIRSFGPPHVTHWRPFHNLYFLVTGDLFGKDYFWYHFFTLIIQLVASFFIFKTLMALDFSKRSAFLAALFYAVNPSHFNTYYWISGGATAISFCFFIMSFFYHIKKQKRLSLAFFTFSLLASEAMVVGLAITLAYDFLKEESTKVFRTNIGLVLISLLFLISKAILTPKSTFEAYKIAVSPAILGTIKFYILRTFGFPGVSKDQLITIILLFWILSLGFFYLNNLKRYSDVKILKFLFCVFVAGLFPFILIPSHLSANYMNIPIFALSSVFGMVLGQIKFKYSILMALAFVFVSFLGVQLIEHDSWVTKRASLAYYYISQIEKSNLPNNSTLVFNDNYISSSFDAYIALGTGDAINFWFKDRNYKTCFSVFENCNSLN